jgi:hypothetical protein
MSITYEDVLRLFAETDRKFQETDRKFQETDRKFQETDRKFQETDHKFQETDRKLQETSREIQETGRIVRENGAEIKEVSASIKELRNLFEGQWGKLMESLVEGDLVNLLQARGIAITDTISRLRGQLPDGGNYEFDILAHNGEDVVVVEVKTTLKPGYVRKFIKKMGNFKTWLPRYASNRLYGAMAWLTSEAGAEVMLVNQGLFSIRATGDSARIMNPSDFAPRAW